MHGGEVPPRRATYDKLFMKARSLIEARLCIEAGGHCSGERIAVEMTVLDGRIHHALPVLSRDKGQCGRYVPVMKPLRGGLEMTF